MKRLTTDEFRTVLRELDARHGGRLHLVVHLDAALDRAADAAAAQVFEALLKHLDGDFVPPLHLDDPHELLEAPHEV